MSGIGSVLSSFWSGAADVTGKTAQAQTTALFKDETKDTAAQSVAGGTAVAASTSSFAPDQALVDAAARTKVDAQVIGQKEDLGSPAKEQTAAEKFLEYQKKTPEEKMYDQILASKGLTEEDVAAMSPEDRQKLMEEIKETIRKKIEEKSGIGAQAQAVGVGAAA